jgi:hypothetical protein
LHPAELGQVQVTVSQPENGPTSVSLEVSRPETLLLLLRDQQHLHQALDHAGIDASPGNVTIQLAKAPEAPTTQPTADPSQAQSETATSSDTSRGSDHERPQGNMTTMVTVDEEFGSSALPLAPTANAVPSRTGIDIMA